MARFALIFFVLLLVAGVVIVANMPPSPSQSATSFSTADAASAPPAEVMPDMAITTPELSEAYSENEVAADNAYKGKTLAVTGIVSEIGKDYRERVFLLFDSPLSLGIRATMNDGSDAVAGRLQKWQKVTVACKHVELFIGHVMMDDCAFPTRQQLDFLASKEEKREAPSPPESQQQPRPDANEVSQANPDNGPAQQDYSEKAAMLMYGIIAQKIHPEPLDASFTQPKILAIDHNDSATKDGNDSPVSRISGTVILECVVDTDGRCPQWKILKSVDPREDQAVVDGLAGVQFQPATEYGQPIAYPFIYKVTLNFAK
jgi:TonB family protein